MKLEKGKMLPDKADYRVVDLITKHTDEQAGETQADFMVTNVPCGKMVDFMGRLFKILGRISRLRSVGQ